MFGTDGVWIWVMVSCHPERERGQNFGPHFLEGCASIQRIIGNVGIVHEHAWSVHHLRGVRTKEGYADLELLEMGSDGQSGNPRTARRGDCVRSRLKFAGKECARRGHRRIERR